MGCAQRRAGLRSRPEMFLTRSEYDRGVNTFSPEGRLFQVEYAMEAIKLGSTAIGVATKEGVVLVVEKRVTSTLLEPSSIEKIMEVDSHLGCAMSGLTADARTLVDHARVEAQNHHFTFNERIPVRSVTQSLSDKCLAFGEGDEEDGPMLYHTDPSGTFVRFTAKAIGSGTEGAQTALQEEYTDSLTLAEAEVLALKTLKQVMEEKVTPTNVDIAVVNPTYKLYSTEEVKGVIERL